MQTVTRRTFIHTTAAATAVFAFQGGVHAAGSDVIRVGLVGCGGRGTGAARDALLGSEGVELVALGDLFPDRLECCRSCKTAEIWTDVERGGRVITASASALASASVLAPLRACDTIPRRW
jgi:hypothetical protein